MRNSRNWEPLEMPTEYRTITEIAGPLIFAETRPGPRLLEGHRRRADLRGDRGDRSPVHREVPRRDDQAQRISGHARTDPERGRRTDRRRTADRAGETGRDHRSRD